MRAASPSSSEGVDTDEEDETEEDRYGRPVQRLVGGYASLPLASPPPREDGSSWDPVPDSDLNAFATQFRSLVEEVTRATNDAAAAGAHPDRDRDGDGGGRYAFPASYAQGRDRDRDAAHVVLGRTIHRMPTIESLGSHEVMSLASRGGFSRTSTRSNTLSTADAPTSRSASRANSLDAAVSLSVSVDGPTVLGMAGEMGEMTVQTPSSTTSACGPVFFGSRSTAASFHTARSASAHMDDSEEG